MYELLAWVEGSALGNAIRGAGVWTYGIVNLTHILGVAALFGAVLVLDLRLLGLWRRIGLASIAAPTVPVAATGFVVAVASGIGLISTNATEYDGNPFLYIKFSAIGLALVNVVAVTVLPGWRARAEREPSLPEQRQLAAAGGLSLACWVAAVGAGRMIGYW